MTVKEISGKLGLGVISLPEPDREVRAVYLGHLPLWVMRRAPADPACVILAEGVTPDPPALEAASTKGINVLTSDKTSYRVAAELAMLGVGV